MATPDTLDFAKLSAPIAGEAPTGADLRTALGTPAAAKYQQLALLRKQATSFERDGGADALQNAATAWRTIRGLAEELLATATKDLQVCAWFIESLLRERGFAGLRDGLRLARELVAKYWEQLHPAPEPGEPASARVEPLCGLNGIDAAGTLITPIGLVPVTKPGNDGAFTAYDWTNANTPYRGNTGDANFTQKNTQREQANAEAQKKIRAAVAASGAPFYVALRDDLEATLAQLAALEKEIDPRCGGDALPTSSIRNAVTAVQGAVLSLAKELLPAPPAPAAAAPDAGAATDGAAPTAGPAKSAPPPGAIATRADALATLRKVAEFFRTTEPHSPLSYMLEQVVRYGGLTLPELLAELLPDKNAREALFTRTGIQPPAK